MDSRHFTEKLENAYRNMWDVWCEQKGEYKTEKITTVNDTAYHVPVAKEFFHTFVLYEQRRWFEGEIKFICKFLKPEMKVIDVGACFGFFLIEMAKQVGEKGSCLAFEPSSDLCAFLKLSIKENRIHNARIIEAGLGSKAGGIMQPHLKINQHKGSGTEKNDLEQLEYARILQLDEVVERYRYNKIDFLRLDASGNEIDIMKGGEKFFVNESPLIMYDFVCKKGFNYELVDLLEIYGYKSYVIVPGFDILVPFDRDTQPDSYLLNLFACKQDTADRLFDQKLLCNSNLTTSDVILNEGKYNNFWKKKAYFKTLKAVWESSSSSAEDMHHEEYYDALNGYIFAHDEDLPLQARVDFLRTAFEKLKTICELSPTLPRLLSLVRIANDLGKRKYAVDVLNIIYELFKTSTGQLVLDEEHLAATERFDKVDPGHKIGEWCLASVIEAKIQNENFSSYFDMNLESLGDLELLKDLGFQSEEMKRRLTLLKEKLKESTKVPFKNLV